MGTTALRVVSLSDSDRKRLRSNHPGLQRADAALVISGSASAVLVVEEFARSVARDERQSDRVLEVLTEAAGDGVLDESRVLQLQRLAAARDRFLKEFGALRSHEIAALSGSRASNTAALANGWKAAGRIFALKVARNDLYPAFQFDEDGRPLPVIAEVLEVMRDEKPWTVALWFVGRTGWLGGRRPVELLRSDSEAVVEAARRTKAPLSL